MAELDFAVEDATLERYSAAPQLNFSLRVRNLDPAIAVQNVMLRCQIRIEPVRRGYAPSEQERLSDLFGLPERWGETLRSFLWTHVNLNVPGFDTECRIDLPVPCSFDFNIAATKYFHGLDDGEAPLSLLFSGSMFYLDPEGRLQIAQIPWEKESRYRLPIALWQAMMQHYYPNGMWLCLGRDAFEKLYRFKRRHGCSSWEQALDRLLAGEPAEPAP